MVMLTLFGDPDVMAKIKSSNKHWQLDESKQIYTQAAAFTRLKGYLGVPLPDQEGGIDGIVDLYTCNAAGVKGKRVDLLGTAKQLSPGNRVYLARPANPRKPAAPKAEKAPGFMPSQRANPQPQPRTEKPAALPPRPATIVSAPPVAPVDWEHFIQYWEAQADEEMKTL
ncbi:hypothetical protein DIPPA_15306 [Diplonema papillatum]|nr:hypothetical protein DIPPA_15306 [Diplonema papillatum]